MDDKKFDDGGPAFPNPHPANVNGMEGMTLWDFFAAAILSGVWEGTVSDFLEQNEVTYEIVAESAGKLADAMLAERRMRFGG